MTALSAAAERKYRNLSGLRRYNKVVTSGETVYQGGMVCGDTTAGTVEPADDAADLTDVIGIAQATVVGDGTLTVEIHAGMEVLMVDDTNLTEASVGTNATVLDDNTLSNAATTTNDVLVGTITEQDGTSWWVRVGDIA